MAAYSSPAVRMAVGLILVALVARVYTVTDDVTTETCDVSSSFVCDDTQCIDMDHQCNGISECRNGRDESVAICGCPPWEFQCNDTLCIDNIKRCDTKVDCINGRDETGCETHLCPPSHIKCHNHFCVPRELACDFKNDCGDNSDELSCPLRDCYGTDYQCDNNQCITNSFLCDGTEDCYDGSDERNCDEHVLCENQLYVSSNHQCDGWVDCLGSQDDELGCPCNNTVDFQCTNSRCVRQSNVCDGVCDCGATCEDEQNCTDIPCLALGRVICPRTHRCIKKEYVCDGVNDCRNNERGHDEEMCEETCDSSYRCSDGKCLHYDLPTLNISCDFISDCTDREDEINCEFPACTPEAPFRCHNGQCITAGQVCDTNVDCYDMSDEKQCADHACRPDQYKCPGSGQCLALERVCDFRADCMGGTDESDCFHEECTEDQFKCRSGQCTPQHRLCMYDDTSDVTGCVDQSHLLNCKTFQCPDGYFKCRNSYCIRQIAVCDTKIDCLGTYTDERGCKIPYECPFTLGEDFMFDFGAPKQPKCMCYDLEMNCERLGLKEIPDMTHEPMNKLRFGGNCLNYSLSRHMFEPYSKYLYLDISNNSITYLGPGYFSTLWRLLTLNIADNKLTEIENGTFVGLTGLQTLYLNGNQIRELYPYSFLGLSQLTVLDLSHQRLKVLPINVFNGLRSIRNLILSHNPMTIVEDGAFSGLPTLMILDLSNCRITNIGDNVFNGLLSLQELHTDEFRFCCLARSVKECWPKPDEFSSCEDLMSNTVLRVCIWVLGLLSFVGNTLVIYWRMKDTRDSKVHSFLITNLAIGDLLMGVYLLIIASVDLRYRGIYIVYDLFWRQSGLCKFAGFLSTYSSELSVMTLTVITIDRFISIIFPFRIKRMSMRDARIVMVAVWGLVFALAAVPLANISYFHNFYGRSGVCLALHITPEKPSGWQYSVFVFLALNLISFLMILFSYLWMFVIARRTRAAARSPQMRTDRAMARRMTLIVLTDFFCWIPIIGLGIASLYGVKIPTEVFAWIAVFVLPLNSAINPILYTISTASFMGHARRRAFKFRKSFMSSFNTNDTTKTTMASGAGSFRFVADKGSPCNDWSRPIYKKPKRHKSKESMFMYPVNGPITKKNGGCYRYESRRNRNDSSTSAEYTRTDLFGYESDP